MFTFPFICSLFLFVFTTNSNTPLFLLSSERFSKTFVALFSKNTVFQKYGSLFCKRGDDEVTVGSFKECVILLSGELKWISD